MKFIEFVLNSLLMVALVIFGVSITHVEPYMINSEQAFYIALMVILIQYQEFYDYYSGLKERVELFERYPSFMIE